MTFVAPVYSFSRVSINGPVNIAHSVLGGRNTIPHFVVTWMEKRIRLLFQL